MSDFEVRKAAALSPSLPQEAQEDLMARGRFAAYDAEAPLRAAVASRPGASAKVVSMALDDRDPEVRKAPFAGGSINLLPEHFDRVCARCEPAQVLLAATSPGWTPEHTARLDARPEFLAQQLAEQLHGMAAEKQLAPLAKAEETEKAISEIPAGKMKPDSYTEPEDERDFDYSHVLPPEHRAAGYRLDVTEHGKGGDMTAYLMHPSKGTTPIGSVRGLVNPTWVANPGGTGFSRVHPSKQTLTPHSNLDAVHRGKGLGMAMYEALFAHAYHKGIRKVRGYAHSEDASAVHRRLAQKHGLEYSADPLEEPDKGRGFADYEYELKSELSKAEDPLASRRAAAFFNREAEDHDAKYLRALWEHDRDREAASLAAHGALPSEENLRALRGARAMLEEEKATPRPSPPRDTKVEAAFPEGEPAAEGLQRAYASGEVEPVELPGRNNPDSYVARDREGGRAWLLKKVRPDAEAAFWQVAHRWGLGPWVAKVELVRVGGVPRAAVELQPWSWESLEDLREEGSAEPGRLLKPFLAAGVLHRLAALDYVLGNEDRNAGNLLVSPDRKRFRLIDEGNSLAPSFDPGRDKRSYVPAYLRAWGPEAPFNRLAPEEKLKLLPRIGDVQAADMRSWLEGIDAEGTADDLRRYGHDPLPSLERLAKLRAATSAEPPDLAVNRLWVGA